MYTRFNNVARWLFTMAGLIFALGTTPARGDGSILFNGSTSKLQNNDANILAGSDDITVCVWVKAAGIGGTSSRGLVFSLDETAGKLNLGHHTSADTMNWSVAFDGGNGVWTFPVTDEVWRPVSVVYNKSLSSNDPTIRVNFAQVTLAETSPMGNPVTMAEGYCVGNATNQAFGWDGEIAHLQVFNRILSPEEQDACLRKPGSVTNGLRLWLPMPHGTDVDDRSVNRLHGTATDLATGASGPAIFTHPLGAPSGIVFLTAGILPVTQFVIPRYADGINYPSGELRGSGKASVLRANAATRVLPADRRAIVMTEDYEHPNNIDYWQAGALNFPITGAITGATNAMPIVITSTAHGRATGQIVTISGVGGNTAANDTWTITKVDNNQFSLDDSTGNDTYTSGGMWSFDQPPAVLRAVLRDLTIAGHPDTAGDDYSDRGIIDSQPATHHKIIGPIASISGTSTVTVTSPGHTLQSGEIVEISGILGGFSPSSGTFTITRTDDDTFTLNSAMGNGSPHTANTGVWRSENSFSWPDKEHGALLKSSGVTVEGVTFFYIPGTCLVVGTGNGPENRNGAFRPFDSEKARIWNCQFHRAYRGVEIRMVDALVGRLNGFGLRDFGIKFTAGSAQIDGALHFYGVGIGGVDQPAVWFASTGGGCWGGPIYAENSPVGMRVQSSGNKLTGFYSKNCFLRNLWITGERNSIENFEIDEIPNGITENGGAEAILIGASANTLSNGTIGGGQAVPDGEVAIRVRDGNAGERLKILNVSFQGTEGSSAPLISIEEQLRYARIDVIAWCNESVTSQETFVDLYTGDPERLGPGNVIFITAQNYHTPVKLPPGGWDKDSNLIVANGVRVLGSITGATDTSPIVITSAGHELREGEKVSIAGVEGNTAANGSHYVKVLTTSTFELYADEGLTTEREGNDTYTPNTGYFGNRFNSVDVAGN